MEYQQPEEIGENGNGVTVLLLNQSASFVAKSINPNHGEVGVIFVTVAGADASGNGVTGSKLVRYRKSYPSGVLTMGTVVNVLPVVVDTGMTGCTFNITANATTNQIDISVTGTATPKEIGWKITIDPQTSVSIPAL